MKKILATFLVLIVFSTNLCADEKAVAEYLETIKDYSPKLRQFMEAMPKGADLHNHLVGAVYAETFLDWAAEDGLCVDLSVPALRDPQSESCDSLGWISAEAARTDNVRRRSVINALSVRSFVPYAGWSGHNQFFVTFERMASRPDRLGDMIAAVSDRSARQNIQYLELMQTPVLAELIGMLAGVELSGDTAKDYQTLMAGPFGDALPRMIKASNEQRRGAFAEVDQLLKCGSAAALPGCDLEVRLIHQVVREFSPAVVFAQIILGWELMAENDGPVALNLVAPEDGYLALRDYTDHMQMIDYLYQSKGARNVTLHAGELTLGLVRPKQLRFHIGEAIELGHAKRIGHGIAISYEDDSTDLLKKMAEENIMVEINLTSNDVILGIKGSDHPMALYREYGVPMALSTDDEGVSRIDLTHEYMRAVTDQNLSYHDLKRMSLNGIRHAFLPDDEKELLWQDLMRAFEVFERTIIR